MLAARMGERERALEISQSLTALDRPYLLGEVAYYQARIAAVLEEHERAVAFSGPHPTGPIRTGLRSMDRFASHV